MGLDMYLEKVKRGRKINDIPWEEREEVAYWRKANHIHKWFVDNVQDGEDDCQYHNEVTRELLLELAKTCNRVLLASELVDGEIICGHRLKDGDWVPETMPGKVVKDPNVAEELLPTESGFFFGGTEYDEYYIKEVQRTLDLIEEIFRDTDFESEAIYYCSSW